MLMWAGQAQEGAGGEENETLGTFPLSNLVPSSFRKVAALAETILTVAALAKTILTVAALAETILGPGVGTYDLRTQHLGVIFSSSPWQGSTRRLKALRAAL